MHDPKSVMAKICDFTLYSLMENTQLFWGKVLQKKMNGSRIKSLGQAV